MTGGVGGMNATDDSVDGETPASTDGRRRSRMVISIAVVVNVVLLVGIAGAIVRSVGGADAATRDRMFVLPPEDARNVSVISVDYGSPEPSYDILYTTVDGTEVGLGSYPTGTNSTGGADAGFDLSMVGRPDGWPHTNVELEGFDEVVVTCLGVGPFSAPLGSVEVPGTAEWAMPPMGAFALVEGSLVRTRLGVGPRDTCDVGPAGVERVVAVESALRLVDRSEWYAYVASQPSSVQRGPSSAGVQALPSVPIPDEFDARSAIGAAVAGLDSHDAEGRYPNLEDGNWPNDYADLFETARVRSNAVSGAEFLVTDIGFLDDTTAVVRFTAVADLGDGPTTFPMTGRMMKIGDRWMVSRATIESMLGRATTVVMPGS